MKFQPFTVFCIACFLLSISYGTTFLLSMLVQALGGTASDAGRVFAVAMLSTLLSVVGSGHLLQRVGAARAIAVGAKIFGAQHFRATRALRRSRHARRRRAFGNLLDRFLPHAPSA